MSGVVLVQPRNTMNDTAYAPLGLLSLASAVRYEYDVKVVDLRYQTEDYLHRMVDTLNPSVIGFSVLTGGCIKDVVRISRQLWSGHRRTSIVLGGVHPTLLPNQTLKNTWIDGVVSGDGEEGLSWFLRYVEREPHPTQKLVELHNTRDLNNVLSPAWDLINVPAYVRRLGGLNIYTSKGCPFPCTFCHNTVASPKWRAMSAERAAEEVEHLVRTYGVKHFIIHDDNFVVDEQRALEFGLLIRDLKITYSINIRIDSVKYDFLRALRTSGLNEVRIGCESGSDRVLLSVLKKGITARRTERAVRTVKHLGLKALLSFVMGWPGETIQERQETIGLCVRLQNIYPSVQIFPLWIYNPYPGTALFDEAVKRGFEPPKTFEEWGEFNWGTAHLPWIERPKEYEMIHRMSRVAWYNRRNPLRRVLRWVARLRLSKNEWRWGVDVWIITLIMRTYQWLKRKFGSCVSQRG